MSALHPTLERSLDRYDRPDTLYSLVVGIYTGLLVAPAIAGLLIPLDAGPGVVYLGFLTVITGTVVATGWVVSRRTALAERFGGSALGYSYLAVPLVGLLGYGLIVATGNDTALHPVFAVVGLVGSAAALGLGPVLLGMSRSRYTAAVVDEATVEIEWSAGWPERNRHLVAAASVLLMAMAVLSLAAQFVIEHDWLSYVHMVTILTGIAAINVGSERTYRVTETGLERILTPLVRRFYAWDAFEGFTETEETVVIQWRAAWRPSIRFARDQMDDPDAVVRTLEDHLDRI